MSLRVALYHRVSLADRGGSVDDGLARLRRHATSRGWEIGAEFCDATDRPSDARPGLRELREHVADGAAGGVVVVSLARLLPHLRSGVLLLNDWLERGVHLASVEDAWDTTDLDDRLALTRVLAWLAECERARHAEATTAGLLLATFRSAGGRARSGRRRVAVDDLELRDLYHRGLPIRRIVAEVRRRGGRLSIGTFYRHLPRLVAEGKVDPETRRRAVAERRTTERRDMDEP